jgi:hypothetical protein
MTCPGYEFIIVELIGYLLIICKLPIIFIGIFVGGIVASLFSSLYNVLGKIH